MTLIYCSSPMHVLHALCRFALSAFPWYTFRLCHPGTTHYMADLWEQLEFLGVWDKTHVVLKATARSWKLSPGNYVVVLYTAFRLFLTNKQLISVVSGTLVFCHQANMNVNSQNTPHTMPSQVSYGVSIMKTSEKIDHAMWVRQVCCFTTDRKTS